MQTGTQEWIRKPSRDKIISRTIIRIRGMSPVVYPPVPHNHRNVVLVNKYLPCYKKRGGGSYRDPHKSACRKGEKYGRYGGVQTLFLHPKIQCMSKIELSSIQQISRDIQKWATLASLSSSFPTGTLFLLTVRAMGRRHRGRNITKAATISSACGRK